MDLPTCPHCGQSVLDEDVDECPFCGESMSAKPSGKKKPQPAPTPAAEKAAPEKPATKTQTQRPAKNSAPAAESAPSEDEPFAVDKVAMTNAVPLRPKPTKGRTYKVVCPMCETPGYTSPKAGGREVKCANPQCLVPIFTCPEPPPAPVEEAPPESAGLSTAQLGLISIVALLAVGAGVWFFVLRKDAATSPANGVNPVVSNDNNPAPTDSQTNKTDPQPKPPAPLQPQGPDLAKFREEAPERMIRISQQIGGRLKNRNKPLSVHWIALAFAEMGELQKAEAQMDRLSKFSDDEPHYRVLPWVEIGWKQRQREESAKNAADKALEFARNVPASQQESWNEAVSLSALLAALDRTDETGPLMTRDLGDADDGQLWLEILSVSLDHTFNLEAAQAFRPLILPANPAWSGVVWQLVFHDEAKAALDWAESAPGLDSQSESLIAWGEAVVAQALAEKKPADTKSLEAALQELPPDRRPVVTAQALARMGQRYASAGNPASAEPLLQSAQTALQALPEFKPRPMPGMKELYNAKFLAVPFEETAAAAAFEVARLQASLNQKDAAWKSIQQGLDILRSLAPSPTAVAKLQQELKSSPDFVRSDLQSALSIKTDDEARRAFRTYLQKVNELESRAEARLRLQVSLLSQAAHWNLAGQVQAEILQTPAEEAGLAEPYLQTALPWIVLAELRERGSAGADVLEAKLKELRKTKPEGQALVESSRQWMKDNQIAKLAENLGRRTEALPETKRRRWILRLCSQTVLAGQTQRALSFVRVLFKRDPFMGEDAAELISALATENGQGETVWQELERQTWTPTQQIAAYRGFIAAVEPPPEETKAEETKPNSDAN